MRNLSFGTLVAALAARRDSGGPGAAADDLNISVKQLREACEAHGVDPHSPPSLREAKAAFTRSYLERLLRETKGIVSVAAHLAGMTPQGFHDHLRRHGVDADDFRSDDVRRALDQRRRATRIAWSRSKPLE